MLIAGFPAGALQANCYLLAPSVGVDCVVVDPGQDAADPLAAALAEHELRPVAVLLTHGHLDHVASAAAIGREYDVAVYIHDADAYMLSDPLSALSPQLRAGLSALLPVGFDLATLRPDRIESLVGGSVLDLAGLSIAVDHTPGHTGGSMVFRLGGSTGVPESGVPESGVPESGVPKSGVPKNGVPKNGGGRRGGTEDGDTGLGDTEFGDTKFGDTEILLTGDTLFAGSVGRTDLPGGSTAQLLDSIAARLLSRPDDAMVLPGHGPTSTIGAERVGNPFLGGLTGRQ